MQFDFIQGKASRVRAIGQAAQSRKRIVAPSASQISFTLTS